jgi:hypothetical protein
MAEAEKRYRHYQALKIQRAWRDYVKQKKAKSSKRKGLERQQSLKSMSSLDKSETTNGRKTGTKASTKGDGTSSKPPTSEATEELSPLAKLAQLPIMDNLLAPARAVGGAVAGFVGSQDVSKNPYSESNHWYNNCTVYNRLSLQKIRKNFRMLFSNIKSRLFCKVQQ